MKMWNRWILGLAVVAVISGWILIPRFAPANLTTAPTDGQVQAALYKIVPQANRFRRVDVQPYEVFEALSKGDPAGLVYRVQGKGYAGDIDLLVSLDLTQGLIESIHILDHNETPGIGDRMEDPQWLGQFAGYSPEEVYVDHLAGATVSTRAVNQAVRESALTILQAYWAQGGLKPSSDRYETLRLAQLAPEPVREAAAPAVAMSLDKAVLAQVLPRAESFTEVRGTTPQVFEGLSGGEVIGIAFVTENKGFAGPIRILVGTDLNGVIQGVRVLEQNETPGLGDKILNEAWLAGFVGQGPDEITIDAIANATVSVNAVQRGVLGGISQALKSYAAGGLMPEYLPLVPGAQDLRLTGPGLYEGLRGDQVVGIVYETESKGYGGPISLAIGLDPETGKILGIRVLSQKETPGLGDKILDPAWLGSFVGQKASEVQVDMIAHATISAQAVRDGVRRSAPTALDQYKNLDAPTDPRLATLPGAQSLRQVGNTSIYEGLAGEKIVGIVYETERQGYAGPIKMAVGLDPATGKVLGLSILSQSETPGLGDKILDPSWLGSFAGQKASEVQVDMIAWATVSSQAVRDGVRRSAPQILEEYQNLGQSADADPRLAALPGAQSLKQVGSTPIYEGLAGETVIGIVYETERQGYAGPIKMAVGLDPATGKVLGLSILSQSETPGLGDKIVDPTWLGSFAGQVASEVQVDMISWATVSSQAVRDGVRRSAPQILEEYKKQTQPADLDPRLTVLPGAQSLRQVEGTSIYEGLAGEKVIGIVYETERQGYAGLIKMAVGLDPATGKVLGLSILSQSETPGLGDKILDPTWLGSFAGQVASEVQVDMIAWATVSSQAVRDGVRRSAPQILEEYKKQTQPADLDPRLTVLPGAQSLRQVEGTSIYEGLAGEKVIGIVYETERQGYAGLIKMAVGLDPATGKVLGLSILSQSETPGLGDKILDPTWLGSFAGQVASEVQVDMIAWATVSSQAVRDGVRRSAPQILEEYKRVRGTQTDLTQNLTGLLQAVPGAQTLNKVQGTDPTIYEAMAGGEVLGIVYQTSGTGFNGPIDLGVGLDPRQGKLTGVSVLSQSETPGLGDKILDPQWLRQFVGQSVDKIEVDMIAWATVSSQAVRDGVRRSAPVALAAYKSDEPLAEDPLLQALPGAQSLRPIEGTGFYQGLVGEELVGLLAQGQATGYKGPVSVAVGFDPVTRKVLGVRVLSQSETPGLGDKILEEKWLSQFIGRDPREHEVDMIAYATLSSEAVQNAIRQAYQALLEYVESGEGRR